MNAEFLPFPYPLSSNFDVQGTLESLHHGLLADPLTARIFPTPQKHLPTRGTTVKDIVMKAALPTDRKKRGCSKCDNPTCTIHSIMVEGDITVSMANDGIFGISHPITCETPHVVYVITCGKCGLQGVGETSNAVQRGQDYIHAAGGTDSSASYEIARHFQDHEHSAADMSLQLVDSVPSTFATADVVTAERQRLENVWIRRLDAQLNRRRQWWKSLTATGRRRDDDHPVSQPPPARSLRNIMSDAVIL